MRIPADAAYELNQLLDQLAAIDAQLASIAEDVARNPRHVLAWARKLNTATAAKIAEALRLPLAPTPAPAPDRAPVLSEAIQ